MYFKINITFQFKSKKNEIIGQIVKYALRI